MDAPWLSLTVFLPVAAAILIAFLPPRGGGLAKWIALLFSLATLGVALALYVVYDRDQGGFQFVDQVDWVNVGSFDLQYKLGVDGISLPLLLLNAFLTLAAVLVSFGVTHRPKLYFAMLMALSTAVMGVFTALDLVLFFLFWELELGPMFLLISIWGTGRKEYSAMKFLIYTIAGSAFMLVGFLVLAFSANSFDVETLLTADFSGAVLSLNVVFVFLLIGFAVKLPVVPLHTWLPDAHTDAPTAVSVMLAGVLLKMGGYGLIRFNAGFMPDILEDYHVWLAVFAIIGIIYGGMITLRQTDLKRLVAYSSVSHMGFVLLGIAALDDVGMGGAVVQMITHGMVTGMLFVMVGLLYERTHTRQIAEMRGLATYMPYIAVFMVFAGVASLGLPSMAGFVGELLVFLGSWERFEWATIIAVFGILLSAGYILWMLQRVFFGPADEKWAHLDGRPRWWEHAAVFSLAGLIMVVGIYPALVTDVVDLGVAPMMERL